MAAAPKHASARLPLLDEYDGVCRAQPEPVPAPAEHRFRCCNHGYSQGLCEILPVAAAHCCFRYTVLAHSSAGLEIICIEEQNYAPLRWHPTQYRVATGCLEPELADVCMRAQALAFCRSYLARFPLP
ncbi:MAG TPA: hypothetical protein VMF91_04255 [Bryobacteraceae bacterium]|nr:hypothetical protein [Bryobacteraceae bacterium]